MSDYINILDLVEFETQDGKPAWALLSISVQRYEQFKDDIEQDNVSSLDDYGEVLAYEVGKTAPSKEREAELTEEFGYHPDLNVENKVRDLLAMKPK